MKLTSLTGICVTLVSVLIGSSCGSKSTRTPTDKENRIPANPIPTTSASPTAGATPTGENSTAAIVELTEESYASVKDIFEANCATCHATQDPIMNDFAQVKQNRAQNIIELQEKSMPKGPRGLKFAASADGAKLLLWFKTGSSVAEEPIPVATAVPTEPVLPPAPTVTPIPSETPAPTPNPIETPAPTTPPVVSEIVYADVAEILDTNCVVCHGPGGTQSGLPLTTLEEVKGNRASSLAEIKDSSMPPGRPTFATSADGQKLIKWLEEGKDVLPAAVTLLEADYIAVTKNTLDGKCATCHSVDSIQPDLPLSTFADVVKFREQSAAAIARKSMPQARPSNKDKFLASPEGAQLLKWLQTGTL